MGKKKHKQQHDGKEEAGKHQGERHAGPFPLPLAGIAAMVTHQLQSPAVRATLATGLRAAADALSKTATPTKPATAPPAPPQPAAAPAPPSDAPTSPSTTRSPDPDAIAGAIGDAAELVLARLFGKKG